MHRKNFGKIMGIGTLVFLLGLSPLAIAEKMDKMGKMDKMDKMGKMEMMEEKTVPAQPQAAAPMDEEMMAKWKEYTTPNENHKVLDQLVGNWEYSLKMWMEPGTQPEESVGTSEVKWVMDGRFIEQTAQGQSMGQPFTGEGITGYDNAKKQYSGIWFDNMATGMMVSTGTYDATAKTLAQQGVFDCPLRGTMSFRWVTKIIDENTHVFEAYSPDKSGQEFMNMEIVYKRKPSSSATAAGLTTDANVKVQ